MFPVLRDKSPLLLARSVLLLRLELLLLRRRRLASSGSLGARPLARANRFRTSVRLMTPVSLPLMCCPGSALALTAGPLAPV